MLEAMQANIHTGSANALLVDFASRHRRLFVLTGAGCSTESGIPVYRGANGGWERAAPVTYQAFIGSEATRHS